MPPTNLGPAARPANPDAPIDIAGVTAGERRLVETVHAQAARVVETTSGKQRGPVLTGAMDRVTGEIFFGQNTGFPKQAHPALQAALDAFTGPPVPFKGVPGEHSEFNAINQGLVARPGATISDFAFYSVRLRGTAKGDQILMCGNCSAVLKDAKDLTR